MLDDCGERLCERFCTDSISYPAGKAALGRVGQAQQRHQIGRVIVKRLRLVGGVQARVGVAGVVPDVLDVPDEMSFFVLWHGLAPVGAHEPVGRHDLLPGPAVDGDAADEHKAAAELGLVAELLQGGAQGGEGVVGAVERFDGGVGGESGADGILELGNVVGGEGVDHVVQVGKVGGLPGAGALHQGKRHDLALPVCGHVIHVIQTRLGLHILASGKVGIGSDGASRRLGNLLGCEQHGTCGGRLIAEEDDSRMP